MFSVALSVVDMLPAGVSLTSSVAIVEIIDNDEAPVPAVELGFDPVTYRVGEGSGTVELRVSVLSGVLTETIRLNYATSDGSAVAGTDYEYTTGTLTLSSGTSSFTFTVNILEDLDNVDVELAGVFSVALSVVDMLPAGVSLTSSVAIVEIIDNDEAPVLAVELGFDPVTYRVGEGSGTVELRVSVLSGDLTEPITLNYATSDGSAVAGTDYDLTTGTLTLSSGTSSFTFTVNILEDLDNVDVELAGVFTVSLSVVDMLPAGVSLTSSVAIVEIIDNDEAVDITPGVEVVTPTISPLNVPLSEGESQTLEIVFESAASVDVTLTLVLENAVEGVTASDYSLTPSDVFISAGMTSTMVLLTALDDPDLEGEERFDLRLVSASSGVTVAVRSVVTVTIEASDQPVDITPGVEVVTPTISPLNVPLSEGESQTLEIVLESAASVDVTLTLVLENAVEGVTAGDYSLTPTAVFISAGMTSTMVLLTALDDPDREGEERSLLLKRP